MDPPDRAPVLAAFLLGTALAAAIVLAASGGDVHRTATGDGLIYRYVALNLDTPPEQVDPVVIERGTSLRYGRIGLPGAMWLLALGMPAAIPWTHALIMIVSAGAAAAAAVALLPRAGMLGLAAVFVAPGFSLSLAGGFAEVPAIAAALWAVVFASRERWIPASALLAVAILTKEGMVLVLAGLVVWALLRTRRREEEARGTAAGHTAAGHTAAGHTAAGHTAAGHTAAARAAPAGAAPARAVAVLAASIVPMAIWSLVVRARYGHIPLLDPYLDDYDGHAGTPVVALVRGLLDPPHLKGLLAGLAHTAAGIAALLLARTSLFGVLAAASTLQLLTAGPFAWEFIGEAVRVFLPLQIFTLLALIVWRKPDTAARGVTLAAG